MATDESIENDDDFISLEEDDVQETESESTVEGEEAALEEASSNKILYILIAVFTILAFALLGFLIYLYFNKQEAKTQEETTDTIIENIQNKPKTLPKTESYQALINEAKTLYTNGDKEKALSLYNDLSQYNRALTFYNVGVAKLKKSQFKEAIDAFTNSMKHDKLKFESALNIAVCAFGMGDDTMFKDNLTLATKELSARQNSPLYSYYRSLIDYYRGFYAEALVPLRHKTSNYYQKEQNKLLAKLYSAFDNYTEAIKILEKDDLPADAFTLGLLYAHQGEYTLAKKYFQKAIQTKDKPLEENLALALVYNKMGFFKKAADIINPTYKNYKDKAAQTYPIKVNLKASLFDPVAAQKEFQKKLFFNDRNKFSLIFYFAPYRLITAKQTVDNIRQGAKNIHVNEFQPALENLNTSGKISDANIEISRGIKAALRENLYTANAIFHKGIEKYPSSAELHYNLALNYAKMNNFQKAYKHFKRSAVLDTNHFYAPIFAYFCAKLLYLETDKKALTQLENLANTKTDLEDKETVLTLIALAREDILSADLTITKTPFDDILVMIFSQLQQDQTLYKKSADALYKKLPNNIISSILYLDAHHDKQAIKSYAKEIQAILTKPSLNFTSLYSGSSLAKELYIEMLNIAGIVPQAKKMIEQKVREKGADDIASLQTLAYADIYVQEFDQAYAIYNNLIDEHKQQDSNTLFLASVASIGAGHHENAIALLELAKLTNKSNYESRYALGILYHEAKNLEGAAIQYAKIGDGGFQSRYFSFDLISSR